MHFEGTYADLIDRGYLVVRDFVPADVLAALVADATRETLPPPLDPSHDPRVAAAMASVPVSPTVFARLQSVVEQTFPELNAATGMAIDTTYPLARWFRNGVSRLHSDAPPFFQWQDFHEYINFWIPVVKPERTRSGLGFVPWDRLEAHEPEAARLIRGHGCCIVMPDLIVRAGAEAVQRYVLDPSAREGVPTDGPVSLVVERDGQLMPVPIDTDLESLVVCPDLDAGDVIISRGDVLHRSQDADTERLAISVRCFNGQHRITAQWLRDMSLPAKVFCISPGNPMEAFITAFAHLGAESLTRREVMDFALEAFAEGTDAAAAVAAHRERIPQLIQLPPPPGA